MLLRYNSHASISLNSLNKTLITDPWFYEPIYGGMMWQYPRSKISIEQYLEADYIIISHFHPDHFCTKTLDHFDTSKIKLLIPDNKSMRSVNQFLDQKGFEYYFVKDKECFNLDNVFEVTFYCSDNNVDSVQVITEKKSGQSIFNMNDCFLSNKQIDIISNFHDISHAMVFFMGVGPYPGSFDLPLEKKLEIIQDKEESDFKRALNIIKRLKVSSYTAYSNDMTWLRRLDLVSINGSLKSKFYKFLNKLIPDIKDIPLESGDSYCLDTSNINIKTSLINDKSKILSEVKELRSKSLLDLQIKKIEEAEKSFEFNLDQFYNDMQKLHNIFNTEIKNKKLNTKKSYPDHLNQSFDIAIYRIKIVLDPEGYMALLSYDFEDHNLELSLDNSTKKNVDLNLSLPSYLWAALQNNFYSSEDLMNCRFFIQREGPYTEVEDAFWDAFSRLSRKNKTKISEYQELALD